MTFDKKWNRIWGFRNDCFAGLFESNESKDATQENTDQFLGFGPPAPLIFGTPSCLGGTKQNGFVLFEYDKGRGQQQERVQQGSLSSASWPLPLLLSL